MALLVDMAIHYEKPRIIFQSVLLLQLIWCCTSLNYNAKHGCPSMCGNLSIPYPFGIGAGCYRDKAFEITCSNDGISYLSDIGRRVVEISLDEVRVQAWSSIVCYDRFGNVISESNDNHTFSISSTPFTFSNTQNTFTAFGCDIFAYLSDSDFGHEHKRTITGCASLCTADEDGFDTYFKNSSCLGNNNGCCNTKIPAGLKILNLRAYSINTQSRSWSSHRENCSYATLHDAVGDELSRGDQFIADDEKLSFYNSSSAKAIFYYLQSFYTSSVLDWTIGVETCEEVIPILGSGNSTISANGYACGENSDCVNSHNGPGYRCRCSTGYQGNPYLPKGCQDINECANSKQVCVKRARCINKPGDYLCACPAGDYGDGRTTGSGCTTPHPNNTKRHVIVMVVAGVGVGLICLSLLLAIGLWFYRELKRRRHIKLKQKFFKKNGGLLLEQQISSGDGNVEKTKIFVTEELKKATDNFNESRILGKGGSGTVYKGMLSDGRIVAIKKSKIIDESQIGQFINELVILSQINHRNIVRLLGCCLETEVPLLVYEHVSNGTLSHHIHDEGHFSSLSWEDRLRISKEVAEALSYLHSSASIPIFHRDIKSSNILLDEAYRAKVSDFGISRSVPFEKTHLTTLVQGTFGYLDPEYFHSSQFTDKSDVYSFGVVLVELLTGDKPISYSKTVDDMKINLAMHFISAVKEGRIPEVLEQRVVNEGEEQELQIVAKLAKRCLKLVGKKRPAMKEVATVLEGLRRSRDQPHNSFPQHCHQEQNYYSEDEQLSVSIGSNSPNSQNNYII